MQDIYKEYWLTHFRDFQPLIISFLKNSKEGAEIYEPYIRTANTNQDGDPYLRFERQTDPETGNKHKIQTKRGDTVIDFNYLAGIIKLFYFIGNEKESSKWQPYFNYNKNGELEYILNLIDKLKKDEQGNQIMTKGPNSHPISVKGTHVNHVAKIKSPVGLYEPHNNVNPNMKRKFGNMWDRYFNPEYMVFDAHQHLNQMARSNQTGGGQLPLHWFPRSGENMEFHLRQLSRIVIKTFTKCNYKSKALFLAFLEGVNNGSIHGYELYKINNTGEIIRQANNIISPVDDTPKSPYYPNKQPKRYTTSNDRLYDENGNPSDEDMEYQINHLGLESIVRKIVHELL